MKLVRRNRDRAPCAAPLRPRAVVALVLTCVLPGCSSGEGMRLSEHVAFEASLPTLEAPPPLKKTVPEPPVPPWAPASPAWTYVLGVDYGIRSDDGGQGHFLAPRAHGKHNGIDFLAPVGTPLLAACTGKAKSARRGGYGNVVQLVCKLPDDLGGDEGLHASLFYAHLARSNVPSDWTHVKVGSKLGTVGKTGNASGPKIKPHLHLEVIVRDSERAAQDEDHAGNEPKAKAAADRFFELLTDECLDPARFRSNSPEVRRERRADPFVLLTCASKPKPELAQPEATDLRQAQVKWSARYQAGGFDVDRGPR